MDQQQPNDGNKEEKEENASIQEGIGPHFKKGSEDLDQLEHEEKGHEEKGTSYDVPFFVSGR